MRPSRQRENQGFRRILLLLAAVVGVPLAFAQDGTDLTADELLLKARNSFNNGQWAEAIELYQNFLTNYGSSLAGEQVTTNVKHDLAVALLQNKQFDLALGAIEDALRAIPALSEAQKQEMTFWLGVCQMQEQQLSEARANLEKFIGFFNAAVANSPIYRQQNPAVAKVPEARILIASTYLLEEKYREAADYIKEIKPGLIPENRGRATVLELFALLQAEAYDEALEAVVQEYSNLEALTQLAAFQTLTLQLGSQFLENQQYRKAILCLQRIWASDRLIKHQLKRLADLEARLEVLEANPRADSYHKFLLGQMIAKIKRELDNFTKIDHFDAALRLRLATAYQAMRRYREAALIMEDMLVRMEPGPIVESASANLVQCWMQTENWPRVIETAKTFREKFPRSTNLPLVIYLQGIAQQNNQDYSAAIENFDLLVQKFPESEFGPRAQFMKGFTYLLAEDNPAAIAAFQEFARRFPNHEMADPSLYWLGMAQSLNKEFEVCRGTMDDYLSRFPQGRYRGAAEFRKAYAAQSLMDFTTSIAELREYLNNNPGHESESEALVLLGDAYMNEGEMDYGIAAFKRIDPQHTRFFEEGWFKVGKALKLMENYDGLRAHMMQFRNEHPASPRVAEAIYNIGWVYRQEGEDEKAVNAYWDAIREYGAIPSIRSVEDLFPALVRLYKGPQEQAQYLARLRDLREEADEKGQPALAMRALWAQGTALRRTDPAGSRAALIDASTQADFSETNPLLLADFAEALLQDGQTEKGEEMFREMVRWNPRAPQKDRAFAALGLLEQERGNERAALGYFDRFEKETLGSVLYGRVMLSKAALEEERGRYDDARGTLEKVLAQTGVGGLEKAEALHRIGDLYMKEGKPELAVPYYQRIYVMYGRWRDWVARAYLNSGLAFESIKDLEAARKTYEEFVAREDLEDFPETARARERLKELGGAQG